MHKPNFGIFITSFLLLLCTHAASASLHAQEAYKVDEIEQPRCDLSEVPPIDPPPGGKFATALRDNPTSRGAVVVYGLEGEAVHYAGIVKERLINVAGVDGERLITLYGGHGENLRMELWVIPQGAAAPKTNFVEDIKHARQFAAYAYWNGEYCGSGRGPYLFGFGEALKQRPDWQGYIIIHLHRNKRGVTLGDSGWEPDGHVSHQKALRRLANDKSYLVRKFGLASTRIKVLVGANDDWTHSELWLVPPDAEPPGAKDSN